MKANDILNKVNLISGDEEKLPQEILEIKEDIVKKQDFLQQINLKRWGIVYINFGTTLKLEYIDEKKSYKDEITYRELSNKKGITAGSYEQAFEHMGVILNHDSIHRLKKLVVAPITSQKGKNPIKHDIPIEIKNNPFLIDESFVRLSNITTIGIEKVTIKKTKKILNTSNGLIMKLSEKDIEKTKEELKEMFDL